MTDYKRLAERALIIRLLTEVYPTGPVSLVSDTFDFWAVITEDAKILKSVIVGRDGKVVFRPDSGDPVDIICGTAEDLSSYPTLKEARRNHNYYDFNAFKYKDKYYAIDTKIPTVKDFDISEVEPTPEMKGAVECLWEIFGGFVTSKNYRTLDSHVGLIYGDSINLDRAQAILARLEAKGFSSQNIVFGIGSFTYQFVTRDTFSIAVKATYGVVDGKPREIYKQPKTDTGTKNSAVGLIRVEKEGTNYVMHDRQTPEQEKQGLLREIFRDSSLIIDDNLDTLRARLHG